MNAARNQQIESMVMTIASAVFAAAVAFACLRIGRALLELEPASVIALAAAGGFSAFRLPPHGERDRPRAPCLCTSAIRTSWVGAIVSGLRRTRPHRCRPAERCSARPRRRPSRTAGGFACGAAVRPALDADARASFTPGSTAISARLHFRDRSPMRRKTCSMRLPNCAGRCANRR